MLLLLLLLRHPQSYVLIPESFEENLNPSSRSRAAAADSRSLNSTNPTVLWEEGEV